MFGRLKNETQSLAGDSRSGRIESREIADFQIKILARFENERALDDRGFFNLHGRQSQVDGFFLDRPVLKLLPGGERERRFLARFESGRQRDAVVVPAGIA